MDFTNLLTKFAVVEVNKLAGLLNGHMIAQMPFATVDNYVENGNILYVSNDGVLVDGADAAALKAQPFLHYTEEMPVFMAGNEYFALEVDDGICYPRAIALYEGDEFTTNNIANLDAFAGWDIDGEAWATVVAGAITLVNAFPTTGAVYDGPVFKAVKDVLPAGQDAARLTLLSKRTVTALT